MILDDSLLPADIGKAGELRVAFELLIRGLKPAIFYSDSGTDIILSNGKKIGVKSVKRAHLSKRNHQYLYYISFGQARTAKVDGIWRRIYRKRNFEGIIDYWILWLVEHDLFYIIPNEAITITNKMSLTFEIPDELRKNARFKNYQSRSKYEKYKNNWEQLR